jgi:uncharacterized membrane protein
LAHLYREKKKLVKIKIMKLKISNPFWQVLSLGALAGMRSASAPAITSHILNSHRSRILSKSPLSFMQSKNVSNVLKVIAAGEVIADKLPFAPDRIKPFSLFARCLAGSLAGASIYKAYNGSLITGALLGSVGAITSAFGSFYLRKSIVKHANLIDPVIGAIEDTLVFGAGASLIYAA